MREYVTAFIDWNSQISNAQARLSGESLTEKEVKRQTDKTINYVCDRLSVFLGSLGKNSGFFQVKMRIYYGWHRGVTPTLARNVLQGMIYKGEVPNSRDSSRFVWDEPFGDVLLQALDKRKLRSPKPQIHLPDTLRQGLGDDKPREKMVDTALVCDVLSQTRSEKDALKIIMAEDDDVIPAAYVSEAWNSEKGKTIILRKRTACGHLALNGIVENIRDSA